MSRAAHGRLAGVLLTVLCWFPVTEPRAADLPRVFYTPSERAAITAARRSGRAIVVPSSSAAASDIAAVPPSATAPAAATSPLAAQADGDDPARSPVSSGPATAASRSARVEGVTLGRDARAAVWIDGLRIGDGGRWGRYRVRVTRDGARLVAPDGSVREVRVGMELVP